MLRKYWTAVVCWSAVSVLFTLTTGCQIMMKDGGSIGLRLNLGEVGIEFFHESKLTSGDPIIRTDVDQGVQHWLFKADTDGDGEPDTSVEPTEKAVELEEEAVSLEEEAADINEEAVDVE